MKDNPSLARFLAIVAVIALLVHWALKLSGGGGLDAISIALIILGISPWIAIFFESLEFGGMKLQFVQQKIEEQSVDISALKFLMASLISKYEVEHLRKLVERSEFIVDTQYFPEDFKRELRHLRDLGLIYHHPGLGITPLYEGERYKNLHEYFHATDAGASYLKLRREMVSGS